MKKKKEKELNVLKPEAVKNSPIRRRILKLENERKLTNSIKKVTVGLQDGKKITTDSNNSSLSTCELVRRKLYFLFESISLSVNSGGQKLYNFVFNAQTCVDLIITRWKLFVVRTNLEGGRPSVEQPIDGC